MKCRYAYYTHAGGRSNNEDAVLALEKNGKYLFAVADGLGGHDCGEVASGIAVKTLARAFEEDAPFDPASAVNAANKAILEKQAETGKDMKTTVALFFFDGQKAYVAHVGDSRVYLFHRGRVVFQTTDHSASQLAVNVGDITPDQIRHHEDRNVLTRVLGALEQVKVDISEFDADLFERVLVCSDGFWEYVLENEMAEALARCFRPEGWLRKMRAVHDYCAPSGCDNHTAVAAFFK